VASVTAYRQAMAAFPCGCGLPFVLATQKPPGFAQMPTMDLWYAHLDEDQLMSSIRAMMDETSKKAKEAKKKKLHKKDVGRRSWSSGPRSGMSSPPRRLIPVTACPKDRAHRRLHYADGRPSFCSRLLRLRLALPGQYS